jgi:hypothetical protein
MALTRVEELTRKRGVSQAAADEHLGQDVTDAEFAFKGQRGCEVISGDFQPRLRPRRSLRRGCNVGRRGSAGRRGSVEPRGSVGRPRHHVQGCLRRGHGGRRVSDKGRLGHAGAAYVSPPTDRPAFVYSGTNS